MASRGCRVYVGNLPLDVKEKEIDDLFYKYGHIRALDLKTPHRPPAYAFIEFENARDAEDAVRGRDGYDFYGSRLRVEISHGGRDTGGGGGGGAARGRDRYDDRSRDRYGGSSRGNQSFGPSRRTDYRVIVSGLPDSTSWQDLKDHMRRGGEVTFSQVMRERDGTIGLVDFETKEDMVRAIRKLDDSDFKNPYDSARIRVKEDRDSGGDRRRSVSRSPRRSRSRSISRSASPARRSRSASPVRRSKSRSKSRSRSPVSRSPSRSPARSD